MKLAADFRELARKALRGNWKTAVIAGFLASLMGAMVFGGGGGTSGNTGDRDGIKISNMADDRAWITVLLVLLAVLVIWILVTLVISGAAKLGYALFNLNLVDGKEIRVSQLFSQLHRLGDGFMMNILIAVYTLLWSLLFVIPGIIKRYSYAMTPYILAEHPEMKPDEAITESQRIMDGNKLRLFCLAFSFIGWGMLCVLPTVILMALVILRLQETNSLSTLLWMIPCGIPVFMGSLFLNPYQQAAFAAFYRDVAGVKEPEETTEWWNQE